MKELIDKLEHNCLEQFKIVDDICFYNSEKVLQAFQSNSVSETHFNSTTGYGYNDEGREVIEKVFANVFKAEDALVRNQFISGSHALTVTLFALLRPGDILLSITGKPYDTLDEVIGIVDNPSSLKSFNINYEQIDLIDNDFDYKQIEKVLKNKKIKVIEIQRSKGYSTRKSITIEKLEKVIKFIRNIDKEVIIMIDNCYCEFVATKEPIEIGADIAVGSLIKNLGGGHTGNTNDLSGANMDALWTQLIDTVAAANLLTSLSGNITSSTLFLVLNGKIFDIEEVLNRIMGSIMNQSGYSMSYGATMNRQRSTFLRENTMINGPTYNWFYAKQRSEKANTSMEATLQRAKMTITLSTLSSLLL